MDLSAVLYNPDSLYFFMNWILYFGKIDEVYIDGFIKPSQRAEWDTMYFFQRNLTGLNSEFSFS